VKIKERQFSELPFLDYEKGGFHPEGETRLS